MNFLNTQICVVSSESNRRSFGKNIFAVEIFVKKLNFWGGGDQPKFGKSLHFDFFWALTNEQQKKSPWQDVMECRGGLYHIFQKFYYPSFKRLKWSHNRKFWLRNGLKLIFWSLQAILLCIVGELAWGGSVDLALAVGVCDRWQVTGVLRHMTRDMWHMTPDMGHETWDLWHTRGDEHCLKI